MALNYTTIYHLVSDLQQLVLDDMEPLEKDSPLWEYSALAEQALSHCAEELASLSVLIGKLQEQAADPSAPPSQS